MTLSIRLTALLVASLATWLPVSAQTAGDDPLPLSPDKVVTQFLLRSWGANDGLPQNTVNAIAQTPDGYLWIGTEEGLARFDGISFTTYDGSRTAAFPEGTAIRALLVDREGALWIGTRTDGLVRYDGNTFTTYSESTGLTGLRVASFVEDADGTLWVGTYDGGLFFEQGSSFVPYQGDGQLAGRRVTALHADDAGILWVGTDDGLFGLHGETVAHYTAADGLADDVVRHIGAAPSGRLLVSTASGSRLLAGGRVLGAEQLGAAATLSAFASRTDAAGHLWLGTDGQGLVRVKAGGHEILSTDHGLPHDRLKALLFDREGSLWIGTEGGGLAQLRDGAFVTLTEREGLAADMTLTVFEDSRGDLWAGSEGNGVTRFGASGATTYTRAHGLTSAVVLSIQEDAEGAVWVGTYGGGAHRFDGTRFSPVRDVPGFSGSSVFAMHRGPSGTLWMGTDAGVVGYRDGRFRTYGEAEGLEAASITAVYEDRAGGLWVAALHDALQRIAPDGRVETFDADDGFPPGIVTSFHEDDEGILWISTYGEGLFRYDGAAFNRYTLQDGLLSENILQILEDGSERLWMSSTKGIFHVARAALEAHAEGGAASLPIHVYGTEDGLRTTEMNGGVQPAGWKDRNGTLWFTSAAGLAGINPEAARANRVPPLVAVRSVHVDGELLGRQDDATLAPGKKKVEIAYAALTFVAPADVVYEYRLEGYDEEWQRTQERKVSYTNLPPGAYTFHVRARSHDGVWSAQAATASFYLRPFFYQTAWFWALCVVALLGLGFAANSVRVARLKARQRELEAQVEARTRDLREANARIEAQNEKLTELDRFKTRFFANISHEFRTPLTLMVGPLENLLAGSYGPLAEGVTNQMQIMLRNALRLLRLINQLLDLSKLESGKMELKARPRNVVQFLEGIVLSFTAFAVQKGIDLQFATAEPEVELYYEPDKLEKVFFNLLSNAVKFTPTGGRISLSLHTRAPEPGTYPAGSVVVRVRDTGPGIPEADLPYIFDRFRQVDGSDTRMHEGTGIGLALVKELTLLHGGEVSVTSTVGEGTEFLVVLPLGREHLQADQLYLGGAGDDENDPAHGALVELATADFNAMASDDVVRVPPLSSGSDATPLVLIVDDNADIREYVGSCLHGAYRVATAVDGRDGLEKAAALRPDVIISDIMMPRMNGYDFCRAVKRDPELRHTPVILLSAKTSQETINTGLEHGADEYLSKPFNGRELLARLKNLITLRAQERELKSLNGHLAEKVEEQLQIILTEREAYEKQLRAERDRAEEAARLKSAILDNMSHEFRTPMTAILGYSEILEMEVENEHREFAAFIRKNGKRLLDTLNALLDLSRLEAAAVESARDAVDVPVIVERVLAEVAHAAAQKQLELRFDATAGDLRAFFDGDALARVLRILLDNAVKFTPSGGVYVDLLDEAEGVGVRVRDTGIGIGAAFMPQLFRPFHQESMGNDRAFEGNGLNLSIAKRLVDLSGGRIEVASEKGHGTTFTVWLPRDADQFFARGDSSSGTDTLSAALPDVTVQGR